MIGLGNKKKGKIMRTLKKEYKILLEKNYRLEAENNVLIAENKMLNELIESNQKLIDAYKERLDELRSFVERIDKICVKTE